MKYAIIVSIFLLTSIMGHAQDSMDTLQIQTSAVCGTCKKTIERNLSFEKGVKRAELDVNSGILTLIYDQKKNSPEKLRSAVQKTGYDADSLKANPESFKRLPECCRNPSKHH